MASVPRWETSERGAFRATFDEDALAYDRSRPVAPPAVFDDLVDLADLGSGSSVLEIGPGTGQATRQLAERGLRVLAIELGSNLATAARQNLAAFEDVQVITGAFEDWGPGERRFDAVFACNSFHWIDPEIRFHKAASLLQPGGHLVVLSTPWVIPDDADRFWWEVQDDWESVGAERVDPATKHPDRISDLAPLIQAAGLFEDPITRRYPFAVTFTADEYALNLSTQSGLKELAPDARTDLIRRVRDRVAKRGGTVTAHLLAVLTIARGRSQTDATAPAACPESRPTPRHRAL